MNLDLAVQTFIQESRELLQDMESALLGMTAAPPEDKPELVNAIFRAAHTIKGSAGLFSFDHLVAFTHVVESVLDRVRDGHLSVADGLLSALLSCCDHIGTLIDGIEAGQQEGNPQLTALGEPLLAQLRGYLSPGGRAQAPVVLGTPAPDAEAQPLADPEHSTNFWHISVRFGPEVLRNGMDPLSFIRYLSTLGRIVEVLTLADALPDAALMDPELNYLGFEIALDSPADKATIESAFEFVRDECRLRILPPHSKVLEYVELIKNSPNEESTRIGEMLLRCGAMTEQELAAALQVQQSEEPSSTRALGSILVAQQAVYPEVVEAAAAKQKQIKEAHAQESRSIRVDADKLDQLINLVGELIIVGAGVNLVAQRARLLELQEATSKLSKLVEDVRDSALQLRMVKIGATFKRFQRVVHDVSRELGKDIVLDIHGEDTELDKTVVEKIGDPLMHLVRNAMDHGIEPAQARAAQGKPAQGRITLNAFHDSGSIVITVEDDGGGLRRERILEKAIERGLVEAGQHLSDSDIFALIFEPGFSTAAQVTNLSGRGVGMDVVKRNITALRGSVGVHSREGVGTVVTVRLPLTLAIIDGFLVDVGRSVFAIPLDMIDECVAYSADVGCEYTNLRGQVLPYIRLRDVFGIAGQAARRENIVVLKHAGKKVGLVVDTLLGEFQTVIKPLGKIFGQAKCISGSTILGTGDVALILDVPALMQHAAQAAAGEGRVLH